MDVHPPKNGINRYWSILYRWNPINAELLAPTAICEHRPGFPTTLGTLDAACHVLSDAAGCNGDGDPAVITENTYFLVIKHGWEIPYP